MSTRPAAAHRGLRRFRAPAPPPPERCELCGTELSGRHRHLVDTRNRGLACACPPCALLFERPGAGAGQFRTVPDRCLTDPGHRLDDAIWDRLRIPVGVAFLLDNSALGRVVALYPSPAGATESELDPAAWQSVRDATRLAGLLAPDVEALLLHRDDGRTDCHLIPVDLAYELTGRLRLLWRGFDGGAEAHAALADFFAEIARRARKPREEAHRP
ncbi:DUF5947 family protein [Streptomyces sp. MspMP-M5]|uniref:DUF5947 family protein n=1 Tax=unclassified Streptomyces TaxID=2593676 RepID=UPI0003A81C91|nr:DUF5947 family protein [Streptomyces sp. MspMP-M5]MYT27759.1 hypothetical protein [Streptomyces sp. SID8354]